jgi:preprotein translocase subunit SecB
MNKQQPQKQQEYKVFFDFVKKLELKKIWLHKGKFELLGASSPNGTSTFFHRNECNFTPISDNLYVVRSISTVDAINSDKEKLFKINFEFNLLYRSEIAFTDELFERFKAGILPSHSYPYEREFLQNLISRMDLPPLTLPIWRSPVISAEEKSKEVENKEPKAAPKPKVKKVKAPKSSKKKVSAKN